MVDRFVLPAFSILLGCATSFIVRDEMQMPTYMRIKMSTVEHHILSRRKLNPDLLSIIDPNEGKLELQLQGERVFKEHHDEMARIEDQNFNQNISG